MEKEIMFLLGIGIVFSLVVALIVVVFLKEQSNITYVHLKTGNKYFLLEEGMMKIPGEGWVDSVIYTSYKGTFTREKNDFNKNFKKLSEWKKEVQHK